MELTPRAFRAYVALVLTHLQALTIVSVMALADTYEVEAVTAASLLYAVVWVVLGLAELRWVLGARQGNQASTAGIVAMSVYFALAAACVFVAILAGEPAI